MSYFSTLHTHLGEDEGRVVLEVDLAGADGVDGGGPAAEGALAGLLWGGINGLPASVTGGQVWSGHPAVVPHMEVPVRDIWVVGLYSVILQQAMGPLLRLLHILSPYVI